MCSKVNNTTRYHNKKVSEYDQEICYNQALQSNAADFKTFVDPDHVNSEIKKCSITR